jgi:hypothetical protein
MCDPINSNALHFLLSGSAARCTCPRRNATSTKTSASFANSNVPCTLVPGPIQSCISPSISTKCIIFTCWKATGSTLRSPTSKRKSPRAKPKCTSTSSWWTATPSISSASSASTRRSSRWVSFRFPIVPRSTSACLWISRVTSRVWKALCPSTMRVLSCIYPVMLSWRPGNPRITAWKSTWISDIWTLPYDLCRGEGEGEMN